MKKILLIIAVVIGLNGCETLPANINSVSETESSNSDSLLLPKGINVPYRIYTHEDEFDGYRIDELVGNVLVGEGRCCESCDKFTGVSNFSFGIRKYTGKDKAVGYFIVLRYESSKWFFIEDGESLKMIVDDNKLNFEGEGSIQNREIIHGGRVKETAVYVIEKKQIRKLANAKTIKIKVSGRPYYDTACFLPENIANIKRFCEEQKIK